MSEKVRILVLMQVRTPQVHPKSLFGVILGHFGPRNPKKRTCFCPTFTFLVNFMSNFGSKVSQKVIISTFFASNMGWDPSGPSQITFWGHFGSFWAQKPQKTDLFLSDLHFSSQFHVKFWLQSLSESDYFDLFCLKHGLGPLRSIPDHFFGSFWAQKPQKTDPFLSDLHFSCPNFGFRSIQK